MSPAELARSLSETVRSVARKHRGDARDPRETYPVWHVVRVFLMCVLEGVCPWVLYERLSSIPAYRRILGLPNQLISLSQLKKRVKSFAFQQALCQVLSASAARVLRRLGKQEVRVVSMDLTRLESNPKRDVRAAWGKDSQGFFWGYKLGLIASEGGVILGMTLLRANWTEFRGGARLIRMARDTIRTASGSFGVEYVLCDSGFDGEPIYEAVHEELDARVICPPRRKRNPRAKTANQVLCHAKSKTPHREADLPLWKTQDGQECFKKRSGIERLNGQLKDTGIRIDEIPPRWRGVRRLGLICLAKLVIYNLALNVNLALGRPMRSLKALVA